MEVLLLESRLLLSAAAGTDGTSSLHVPELCCCPVCRSLPPLPLIRVQANAVQSPAAGASPTKFALTALPKLSSRTAAPAKLYLDFNGDPYDHNTPAYDQDGDTATFTSTELSAIQEIWTRVAEKYSPFNINVTTVDPGALTAGKVMRVLIGGDGSWYGSAGGLGYVGGFRSAGYNTAWVFSKNMANGVARYTAEAVAHEAGHGFGLQHQSTYENGAKIEEYNEGTPDTAPVMGVSYYANRGLWWSGTSISPTAIQDDQSLLASAINGFGYRPDDYPNTPPTAKPISVTGGQINISGVIENPSDADYFIFQSGAGAVTLSLSVASAGAMLDAKLSLLSTDGRTIATNDGPGLGAALAASVPVGSYRIAVASHGGAGDVGQYTLTGTLPIYRVSTDRSPTGLSAASVANRTVTMRWSDNSTSETGFVIERQSDTGPWEQVGVTGKNATTFSDGAVQAARTYRYRVSAFGPGVTVGPSNAIAVTTPTNAPSRLSASAMPAQGKIALSWADTVGESGYRIERSSDGITWVQVGTTSANTAVFSDALITGSATYQYRVRAFNALGNSSPSNVASAVAPPVTAETPAVPTLLADAFPAVGGCVAPAAASWSSWWDDPENQKTSQQPRPDSAALELAAQSA